jgi:hypothetical protein
MVKPYWDFGRAALERETHFAPGIMEKQAIFSLLAL